MKLRILSAATAAALLAALVLPASASAAGTAAPSAATISNVSGTCSLPSGEAGNFAGSLDITRFVVRHGTLYGVGTLSGTCTGSTTQATQTITNEAVRLPVDLNQSSGSCQILDLTLGPLHLDLLGLVVDLNQVHLTITAQQGPGNLLGNLLCAVAHLLDQNNFSLQAIASLLNQILAAL